MFFYLILKWRKIYLLHIESSFEKQIKINLLVFITKQLSLINKNGRSIQLSIERYKFWN